MEGGHPGEGTQRCSIYGAACSLFTFCRRSSSSSSTPCATVSPVPSTPLAPDMARLALSVLLILCFSLPQLSTARPSRTRKAVSTRQPGGTDTVYLGFFLSCISFHFTCFFSLLFYCTCLQLDAAAEDDDVTSQLERLWQEVNSLKEMQALQTGTKRRKSEQMFIKEGSLILEVCLEKTIYFQLELFSFS